MSAGLLDSDRPLFFFFYSGWPLQGCLCLCLIGEEWGELVSTHTGTHYDTHSNRNESTDPGTVLHSQNEIISTKMIKSTKKAQRWMLTLGQQLSNGIVFFLLESTVFLTHRNEIKIKNKTQKQNKQSNKHKGSN